MATVMVVIDIGNSQAEFAACEEGRFISKLRVATAELLLEPSAVLLQWWQSIGADGPEAVELVSVVPAATRRVKEWIAAQSSAPLFVVGVDDPFELSSEYETPHTLGIDRLVAASAAFGRFGRPRGRAVVVVDCGTATTVDAVDRHGVFKGGAIAPGLGISADALMARGAQLPRLGEVRPERTIGRSTESCVRSGVVMGHAGLVEGLVRRVSEELADEPRVVLTGGWSGLLWPILRGVHHLEPDLVLSGLLAIHARRSLGSPAT